MLKQNDCLLAVNNHPKSKKPFNAFWQLRYLPAKCSPFAKSGKSFPDRTNNICCSQRNNKRGNYGNFEIKIKFFRIFRAIDLPAFLLIKNFWPTLQVLLSSILR